ncbi:chemotaxis protein CheA [Sinimarinibacterium sp. NLF-5-8]|uniref:chemotaxis protein CheA n=1 Tax=Sinimarinibacterium sp. NLF-5-8 TaxID=2698684 RepID=UPI00137BB402|nr:chemotaxis protein CheA [Sinimarinibacterium sp. NLF-5-8]QHS08714.1 chemotaxis protein CheA [Sinimarinibacterium sp. NLF-5-8]
MMGDVDNEILSDFLIEAGELIQRLGGQLVELETRPQDHALLNDIFRAFHTVKGGAGFLELQPLVSLCHAAEDVFNALRSGKRQVDAALMDAVLQALDGVQEMMDAVAEGQPLPDAPETLIQTLHAMAANSEPATAVPVAAPEPEPVVETPAAASDASAVSQTISEDEFEALLDELHGTGKGPGATAQSGDTISEDEFETLLDELHGAGKGPSSVATSPATASGTISEDEFEALLDQLHGVGKGPGAAAVPQPTLAASPVAAPPPVAGASPPASAASRARAGSAEPARAVVTETTVRVDTAKLDALMNLVGELVLVRNRLKDLRARGAAAESMTRPIGELDFITRGLQNAVMQVRMQPVGKVFARFPKIARDVARGLGKQVEVTLVGEDTDLDKNLVEALADPLVHMVRNSVDHGIEMPDERVRKGKPAAGHLTLSARQQGDSILIEVRDDGAGIDATRVRSKAVEKGLISATEAAQMTPDDCLQLVFLPGFSTKEQVSDLSGRGVGMDVVMSKIRALGGSVRMESRLGQGSCVHIRVPLTLAILSALMVSAAGRRYALPLAPVLDVFELDPSEPELLDYWDVVLTRRDTLRLIYLDPWLARPRDGVRRHVVVAQVGEDRYGFVVGEVRGREEIVIKPLGASLRGVQGVSGATVLPDGRVALILDFSGLIEVWRRSALRARAEALNG